MAPREPQRQERGGKPARTGSQEGRQAGRRGEDKGEGFRAGRQMGRSGPRWDRREAPATITDAAVERDATSRTPAFVGE